VFLEFRVSRHSMEGCVETGCKVWGDCIPGGGKVG
jgi:hypothetical protein